MRAEQSLILIAALLSLPMVLIVGILLYRAWPGVLSRSSGSSADFVGVILFSFAPIAWLVLIDRWQKGPSLRDREDTTDHPLHWVWSIGPLWLISVAALSDWLSEDPLLTVIGTVLVVLYFCWLSSLAGVLIYRATVPERQPAIARVPDTSPAPDAAPEIVPPAKAVTAALTVSLFLGCLLGFMLIRIGQPDLKTLLWGAASWCALMVFSALDCLSKHRIELSADGVRRRGIAANQFMAWDSIREIHDGRTDLILGDDFSRTLEIPLTSFRDPLHAKAYIVQQVQQQSRLGVRLHPPDLGDT